MLFIFFLFFSPLFSTDVHIAFKVMSVSSEDKKIVQKKLLELNKKGFICNVVSKEHNLVILCNDIYDISKLAKNIELFKAHSVPYSIVNFSDKENTKPKNVPPFHVGYRAYEKGEYKKAKKIFKYYYEKDKKNLKYAEGYALALMKIKNYKKALEVLKPHVESQKIYDLNKGILISYINSLPVEKRARSAYDLLLNSKISKDDYNYLKRKIDYQNYLNKGWKYLSRDPKKALENFKNACKENRTHDCVEGKAYSIAKSNMLYEEIKNNKMDILLSLNKRGKTVKCYEYAKIMSLDYQDKSIYTIGAWCAYNASLYAEAVDMFEKTNLNIFNESYGLALSLIKIGEKDRAKNVIEKHKVSRKNVEKKANIYALLGKSEKAKSIFIDIDASYYKKEILAMDRNEKYGTLEESNINQGVFFSQNKDGQSIIFLDKRSVPLNFNYDVSDKNMFFYGLIEPMRLSSYNVVYRIQDDITSIGNTRDSVALSFGIKNENLDIEIGSTPIGLEIPAHLTARISAFNAINNFYIYGTLIQRQINETLLSYVGVKANNNNNRYKWGRTIKRGIETGMSYSDEMEYSLNLSYYPEIFGYNTVSNSEKKASLSILHPFTVEDYVFFDIGVMGLYNSFDRNSNLFSYGQGGFFSPQKFHMHTVFADIGRYVGDDLYYRLQTSVGYQSYSVDDTPISYAYEQYGMAYRLIFQGGYHMSENFDITAGINREQMYGFNFFSAAISLTYHLKKRKKASIKNLRSPTAIDRIRRR